MNNIPKLTITCGLVLAVTALLVGLLHSQPPGPPSGPPGDTMKSLREIWDEVATLKTQVVGLETQNSELLAKLNKLAGVVTIEMVTVGNPGNAVDTTGNPNPAGAVAYEYRIGKYEVTNEQYAYFLNAVAATDTNSLYNSLMGIDARGGIKRAGAPPNLSYSVKANMGNKPVNFASWYDALRFCNWLHNGQPSGLQDGSTTEGGAYTLTGATSVAVGTDPTHGANGRNAGARFWLPGEDEWYKAAYHEPGASTNGYWLYPTRSDSAPTLATADLFGNINNDVPNVANYLGGADWNGQNGNVTTVGSGGSGSESFYGAADMGGNVWEWNEQEIGEDRGLRGDSWDLNSIHLQSSSRGSFNPASDDGSYGFRVAGS